MCAVCFLTVFHPSFGDNDSMGGGIKSLIYPKYHGSCIGCCAAPNCVTRVLLGREMGNWLHSFFFFLYVYVDIRSLAYGAIKEWGFNLLMEKLDVGK